MNIRVRWPGANLLAASGILMAFSTLPVGYYFGLPVALPIAGLSGLFIFLGRRNGSVFQWDRYYPADFSGGQSGIFYQDLLGVSIEDGRVVFVPKKGTQSSIPFTSGTAVVLSHLKRIGIRIERKLSDPQWIRAQKTMALWDYLDRSAAFRTHILIAFAVGVPALGAAISQLQIRGGFVASSTYFENVVFLAILSAALSVVAWLMVIAIYFASGARDYAAVEKQVRGTDLWSGAASALLWVGLLFWFHSEDKAARARGFRQPELISKAFSHGVDRMPASQR